MTAERDRLLSRDNPKARWHNYADSAGRHEWACVPISDAILASDLDVERLARALHHVYHDGRPVEPPRIETVVYCDEDAAAIAAAYREDAE